MNEHKNRRAASGGVMSNLRIGQRLIIGMMVMISILVIPIILVMTQSLDHQSRYNRTLENLSDISYIIQETENQGYRIIDYCMMGTNIEDSGETEIVVTMLDKIERIRDNIGDDERYQDNIDRLDIVENLLENYAQSYKTGAGKCGENFSMAGDADFYAMVDTANYIVKNCNKLQSLEMNRSEDLREEISSSYHNMIYVVTVIVAIGILAMVLFVYSITKSITDPLGLLMVHIAEISESGLLDTKQSKETDDNDETAAETA